MFKILVLIIFLALDSKAVPITSIGTVTEGIPNFTQIGGKNYYIEETLRVNWFEATNLCLQLGGSLANLKSDTELEALTSHFHPTKSYWISINDLGVQGIYVSQATGRAVQYFNWSAGQPDNTGGIEHCVELWRSTTIFQMNDAPCEANLFFVCELKNSQT